MEKQLVVIEDGKKVLTLLKEVFTDSFMHTYTRHQDFDSFRFSSMVFLNWDAERLIYDPALLDRFVQESTDFQNFDDMVRQAADEKYQQ